ncbi:hypothetical protein [Paraliomyxa miuraensis]|uniref:hypothetical protein n=1 Tax=Paraliomyxa miuraensis TaxID=376150 RepID=UPI0022566DF4|nr:hypothetical protein [Paraliomyxa miuraensis]MCX4243068.1 hypothetical protein [Paraliomyxa miuraensis]
MTPRSITTLILSLIWPASCQCADSVPVELGSDASSSSTGESSASGSGSGGSSGDPFDASRWIGRYHAENPYLVFGERGDPLGTPVLFNFEILPNGMATSFYDSCSLAAGISSTYEWTPGEDGWLELQPGVGQSSLHFFANMGVEHLRVQLIEPCRELRFEVDGELSTFFTFLPGESCWVDRCTTPGIMQVDYCDGEEPEEACQ